MAKNKLIIDVKTKGAKKSEKQIKGVSGALGNLAKQAGIAAAAFFGTRALLNGIKASIDAFAKQELAEKKLEAALGKTSQALLNHASALQKVTMFGDETIIEAQAMIASFVKDEEAVRLATEATLDLAAAKGFDLVAAADLVSKTLGSSTNALTRYGIEVTGAVGSTERLTSLTENIAAVFGGQATAQAQTLSGAMAQLNNSFGDLQETVATEFADEITKSSRTVTKFIDSITTSLKINQLNTFIASKAFEDLGEAAKFSQLVAKEALLETQIALEENPGLLKQIADNFINLDSALTMTLGPNVKKGAELWFEYLGWLGLIDNETGIVESGLNKLGDTLGVDADEISRLKVELEALRLELQGFDDDGDGGDDEDKISTQEEFNQAKQKEYDLLIQTNEASAQENALLQVWIKDNKDKAKALGIVSDKEKEANKIREEKFKAGKKWLDISAAIADATSADAKIQQGIAIGKAIMFTAEAVAEALPDWGAVAAAIATGATQVGTIKAQKFALGADYITASPELIMVGEAGRERVQVTPLEGPNINGPQGGNITLNISGNVLSEEFTEDVIIPQIKEGLRLGGDIGIN